MHLTKNFLLLFFLSIFVFSGTTRAGVLIEPYLGYSLNGDGDMNITGNSFESSYSSPTIGGRLGYSILGLMFGLDYSTQSFDLENKLASINTTFEDSVKKSQLGVFVGYDLPVLLRVWGTYFISGDLSGQDPNSSSNFIDNRYEFTDGSGYALGAGFTGLPFVSVNLEYRTMEYDTFEFDGIDVTSSSMREKLNLSEILLSVSLPLDF